MKKPRRCVITGGPGAGKSTLLAELARRGFATESEVARTLLRLPGGMEMRAERPLDFAHAMFEAELAAWQRAEKRSEPTIFDRGFPDIVGFLRLGGLGISEEIDQACREKRYDGPVFHAPPWKAIYRSDAERIQSWDEALESDKAISRAWRDYGYEPIELPLMPVSKRADFVIERL